MTEDDGTEAVAAEQAHGETEAPPPPPDPLAEERAALAAERAALARERERARELARVGDLHARVQAYEAWDWDQRTQADPRQAQADWMAYLRARDERDRRVEAGRREHAARLQAAQAEVLRDLPDWTPETARRLVEFGRSMGFSDEELGAISDARQIKVLHAAWRARQRAEAERSAAAQPFAPVPTVGGGGGRIETAPDTDDFRAFERLAAARVK